VPVNRAPRRVAETTRTKVGSALVTPEHVEEFAEFYWELRCALLAACRT